MILAYRAVYIVLYHISYHNYHITSHHISIDDDDDDHDADADADDDDDEDDDCPLTMRKTISMHNMLVAQGRRDITNKEIK